MERAKYDEAVEMMVAAVKADARLTDDILRVVADCVVGGVFGCLPINDFSANPRRPDLGFDYLVMPSWAFRDALDAELAHDELNRQVDALDAELAFHELNRQIAQA